jgi:ABC-type sugar transport system substrate-binding protein
MVTGLYLPNSQNEYYQMVSSDAQAAAKRAGMNIQVHFADNRSSTQVKQIYDSLHAQEPMSAIIVMPIRDDSLNRLAQEAASKGIGWFFLGRRTSYLEELRKQFPACPISYVSPDQREIGRIQGRQARILLPAGGDLIYVQGNAETSSARERLAGFRETISGSSIDVHVLDGNWTASDTERIMGSWLRIATSGKWKLDLVVCQNDEMAMGACKALQSVSESQRLPEIAGIPVTGYDGLLNVGQQMVKENRLVATIVLPSTGGTAVEAMARALSRGQLPPQEILLPSTSFPNEAALAAKSRTIK